MKKIIQGIFIASIHTYALCNATIKVVIPMAGLGTRLLPLTKAVPKSMIALLDKPALHHVIDEALQSDITNFCFIVNGEDRRTIEYYFSCNTIVDTLLAQKKKTHLLEQLNNALARSRFTYITQPEPIGLGHAVLLAEQFVMPDDFFCIMLPDNIIEGNSAHMAELIAIAHHYNASVITIEEVSKEEILQYAAVIPKVVLTDTLCEVADIIEKPTPDQITSSFAQVGRYIFSTDIFASLKKINPGVGGEIQLSDAVVDMIRQGKRVLAYQLKGKRHDIGTTTNLLKTTVTLGLHDPRYKPMLLEIFQREAS